MILLSILGVLVVGTFVIPPYGSEGFFVLGGLSVAVAIIGLITQACFYHDQIDSIERVKECEEREKIHKEKAEALTGEFKLWLGEKYPEIEKGIFKDLIPAKVSILAVSFPAHLIPVDVVALTCVHPDTAVELQIRNGQMPISIGDILIEPFDQPDALLAVQAT